MITAIDILKRLKTRKFNRFTYLVFFLCSLSLFQGCASKGIYNDGEFYGQSEGYYSTVKVKVTILSGKIAEIEIVEHNEPAILAEIVFKELPPKIIKKNGSDVDIISGASYTSKSLLEAVDSALKAASGINGGGD